MYRESGTDGLSYSGKGRGGNRVVVTAEELEGNQIKHAAGSIHICWLAGSGVARQPKLPQRKLRSLKKSMK